MMYKMISRALQPISGVFLGTSQSLLQLAILATRRRQEYRMQKAERAGRPEAQRREMEMKKKGKEGLPI
jgi:hypothetical protein